MGSDTAQAQEGEDTADSPATRSTGPVPSTTLTLMMAALGIVYGDFRTSPLYTLQTVMAASGDKIEADGALGVLSLIVWSLIVTISIKYCLVVMETDNRGEGGILVLMSLIGLNRSKGRWGLVAARLFGASLIYGDGILTPAISVLSALEGINLVTASFKPYVMPAAAVLVGLFVLQTQGTATIGKLFGPVMLLWFIVIAGLGAFNLIQHPRALLGLNPHYGFLFLVGHGWASFPVLGACSWLSPGRGEAMYADMGHIGRQPIRVSWFAILLPALLLSYGGQIGVLLDSGASEGNPFFRAVPGRAGLGGGANGRARHLCDHHCQSGDHHRRIFTDPPGDADGVVPGPEHPTGWPAHMAQR